jgi:hypothetical protein
MAEFLADNRIYAEWKAQSLPSLGREQITTILTALRTAQGRLQLHNPAQRRVQGRRNKTSSLDGRKEVKCADPGSGPRPLPFLTLVQSTAA